MNSAQPAIKSAGKPMSDTHVNSATPPHSLMVPSCVCPMKMPMTISTIGVTAEESMCRDVMMMCGNGRCMRLTIIPAAMAMRRGLVPSERSTVRHRDVRGVRCSSARKTTPIPKSPKRYTATIMLRVESTPGP